MATEETIYDAEGRATKVIDRAGRATLYTHDALGRLVKTTYSDGTFTTTTYNAHGQVVAATDINGQMTRYEFDAAGRNTKVTDAIGNATTFTYDANGNRLSMTDARGHTTRYEYDANNRQTRIVYPDGTSQSVAYDNAGRTSPKPIRPQDNALRARQARQLKKVTDSLAVSRFHLRRVGTLLTQTDANTTRRGSTMTNRGGVSRHSAARMSESYVYDIAGNLTSQTDFNGKRDDLRLRRAEPSRTRTPDPATGEPAVTLHYTATGQRETMTDATGNDFLHLRRPQRLASNKRSRARSSTPMTRLAACSPSARRTRTASAWTTPTTA